MVDGEPGSTDRNRTAESLRPLHLRVVTSETIPAACLEEILSLCHAAYGEDLTDLFGTSGAATHVLGSVGDRIVSHAMWITRWLQCAGAQPLGTAYVEAVATLPAYQGRGHATAVMQCLAAGIPASYELSALSPAETSLYARLGWQCWRGPLSIRMPSGLEEPTPEERIMVLELPGRAKLNLDAALSAEWREGEPW